MPYDKTVWDETVGVTPARLNNLELQYEKALADYPKPLNYDDRTSIAPLTVGVGKQFATISAAINSLKKINAGERTIIVDPGTYDESVFIWDFIGGKIILKAPSGTAANILIRNLYIERNNARVEAYNFKINVANAGFRFQNTDYVYLQYFDNIIADTSTALILENVPSARLVDGVLSNHSQVGIDVYNSKVYLESVSGSGNGVGISASFGAIVQKSGSTITGTTPEYKGGGSQIWS